MSKRLKQVQNAHQSDVKIRNQVRRFYIWTTGIALVILSLILKRAYSYTPAIIPLSGWALIAGAFYENLKITRNVKQFYNISLLTFFCSLVAFAPTKNDNPYILNDHVFFWIYVFFAMFVFGTIVCNLEKITPKISEGITLLQSIAVVYWLTEYNLINYGFFIPISINHLIELVTTWYVLLLYLFLIPAIYSLYHAFSKTKLSRNRRFIMSLWSTFITSLFAIEQVIYVISNQAIEILPTFNDKAYVSLEYFLLGSASIYIALNISMLVGFLPGSDSFFNKEYFKQIKKLKNKHITRFSRAQLPLDQALFAIILATTIFTANYYLKIVPHQIAIWGTFMVFPYIVHAYLKTKTYFIKK